jgi:HEAT repeat protein
MTPHKQQRRNNAFNLKKVKNPTRVALFCQLIRRGATGLAIAQAAALLINSIPNSSPLLEEVLLKLAEHGIESAAALSLGAGSVFLKRE